MKKEIEQIKAEIVPLLELIGEYSYEDTKYLWNYIERASEEIQHEQIEKFSNGE